jgi:hypothetical protein
MPFLIFGLFWAGVGLASLMTGLAIGRFRSSNTVSREDNPVVFWCRVTLFFVASAILIGVGVWKIIHHDKSGL